MKVTNGSEQDWVWIKLISYLTGGIDIGVCQKMMSEMMSSL